MNLFFRWFVERGKIKIIKGRKRDFISTNDLDSERKLNIDYLKNRERRKRGEID